MLQGDLVFLYQYGIIAIGWIQTLCFCGSRVILLLKEGACLMPMNIQSLLSGYLAEIQHI